MSPEMRKYQKEIVDNKLRLLIEVVRRRRYEGPNEKQLELDFS